MKLIMPKALTTLPTLLAYESFKQSTLLFSKKISTFIEHKINLNRVMIITAVALSALAVVASIVTGSFLALSLSIALGAAGCLTYKINNELIDKTGECRRQIDFIINEERRNQEHLAEHARMSSAISRQELIIRQLEGQKKDLESKLARAVELLDFCDKVVTKATDFTQRTEETTKRSEALADAHEVELKDIKEISSELKSYKGVLGQWIEAMKKMLATGETEFTQKVLRVLQDFKEGQHTELAHMFSQLKLVQEQFSRTQEQINATSAIIAKQNAELTAILAEISDHKAELRGIHAMLFEQQKKITRQPAAHDA